MNMAKLSAASIAPEFWRLPARRLFAAKPPLGEREGVRPRQQAGRFTLTGRAFAGEQPRIKSGQALCLNAGVGMQGRLAVGQKGTTCRMTCRAQYLVSDRLK